MRIVLDLQGAQSPGSLNRGIGRYSTSFAKAIIRNRGNHDVFLALNGSFSDTIDPIRKEFSSLIPQDQIHVWHAFDGVGQINPVNRQRRLAAELCRETFLANMDPDILHVSSHFEGLSDDAVSSIGRLNYRVPTSVTLFDLIPLLHAQTYLENADTRRWYFERLDHLRRADLLLSISVSSRREAIDHLSFAEESVVNVGTAADPQFRKLEISQRKRQSILARLGLYKPFVMYTGGIDYRKNIERTIEAFAQLDVKVRSAHQLAIICSVSEHERKRLQARARDLGLDDNELVMTGYADEQDLIALYNMCALFIFPSWHEGFGLPALEAMWCGAPVIGSNRSSIPEVIGLDEALFDPFSVRSISETLHAGLTDKKLRSRLLKHASKYREKFSWDATGQGAISALESCVRREQAQCFSRSGKRPTLALVSPVPPTRSGIADYSAKLLPELGRHYDVTVVVRDDASKQSSSDPFINACTPLISAEQFAANASCFDRIVYQVGNSEHHEHQFDIISDHPGVVVLHDFFLSGILNWIEHIRGDSTWNAALYHSHGYAGLITRNTDDPLVAIGRYPSNLGTLENALGVIVHSEFSKDLGEHWIGRGATEGWSVILQPREHGETQSKSRARTILGIDPEDFVVCSFGFMGFTKLNICLLQAWLVSPLSKLSSNRLIFVGVPDEGEYGAEIRKLIDTAPHPQSISISGWTEKEAFNAYLSSADMAVQLRTFSRGETSAAVIDCMNYGIPTVVNANGSMANLPRDCVIMIPDEFGVEDLAQAITDAWRNPELRDELGQSASEFVRTAHSPRVCADAYADAIEQAYSRRELHPSGLSERLRQQLDADVSPADLISVAQAATRATQRQFRQVAHLDVSNMLNQDGSLLQSAEFAACLAAILSRDCEVRVEPVRYDPDEAIWRYARRASLAAVDLQSLSMSDEPVDFRHSDIIIYPANPSLAQRAAEEPFVQNFGLNLMQLNQCPKIEPIASHELLSFDELFNSVGWKAVSL